MLCCVCLVFCFCFLFDKVDVVLDKLDHMQNLRRAIFDLNVRVESAVKESSKNRLKHRLLDYLRRYCMLIVVASYLQSAYIPVNSTKAQQMHAKIKQMKKDDKQQNMDAQNNKHRNSVGNNNNNNNNNNNDKDTQIIKKSENKFRNIDARIKFSEWFKERTELKNHIKNVYFG